MTFSIHMANIVFHDKPVESDGEAEEIRNDPTSFPHSRGTRWHNCAQNDRHGIIPAFAGNTNPCSIVRHTSWDHPRIRGEHRTQGTRTRDNMGSSPHSRGTHRIGKYCNSHRGIIPAFAGNTEDYVKLKKMAKDHPRIRGEHISSRLNSRIR